MDLMPPSPGWAPATSLHLITWVSQSRAPAVTAWHLNGTA